MWELLCIRATNSECKANHYGVDQRDDASAFISVSKWKVPWEEGVFCPSSLSALISRFSHEVNVGRRAGMVPEWMWTPQHGQINQAWKHLGAECRNTFPHLCQETPQKTTAEKVLSDDVFAKNKTHNRISPTWPLEETPLCSSSASVARWNLWDASVWSCCCCWPSWQDHYGSSCRSLGTNLLGIPPPTSSTMAGWTTWTTTTEAQSWRATALRSCRATPRKRTKPRFWQSPKNSAREFRSQMRFISMQLKTAGLIVNSVLGSILIVPIDALQAIWANFNCRWQ